VHILFQSDGELQNVRLLDHQLLRDSTPVHDLSYFFYSGASKKDFDKLDEYLELYYESFCSFCRELGSDPEKLLPFEALKSDWKKFSLLGIKMGLMIWQVKLLAKEEIAKIVTKEHSQQEFTEGMNKTYESDTFKRNISDILLHAVEYNILWGENDKIEVASCWNVSQ